MDYSPPGSSVHGILQARILEWVAMPSSRASSQLRDWTWVFWGSCIGGGFLTSQPLGKPNIYICMYMYIYTYICLKYHPCSNRQWLFCRTPNRAWVSSLLFRNSLLSFMYHWVKGLLNNWRPQEGSGGERDVRCLRLWLSKRNIDAKKSGGVWINKWVDLMFLAFSVLCILLAIWWADRLFWG